MSYIPRKVLSEVSRKVYSKVLSEVSRKVYSKVLSEVSRKVYSKVLSKVSRDKTWRVLKHYLGSRISQNILCVEYRIIFSGILFSIFLYKFYFSIREPSTIFL
jgi:hypothetical protein